MLALENYQQLRKYCFKKRTLELDVEFVKFIMSGNFGIPERFINPSRRMEEEEE